jgi:hypothetical protein
VESTRNGRRHDRILRRRKRGERGRIEPGRSDLLAFAEADCGNVGSRRLNPATAIASPMAGARALAWRERSG